MISASNAVLVIIHCNYVQKPKRLAPSVKMISVQNAEQQKESKKKQIYQGIHYYIVLKVLITQVAFTRVQNAKILKSAVMGDGLASNANITNV